MEPSLPLPSSRPPLACVTLAQLEPEKMWSAIAKAAPPPTVAESDTHIPEGRTRIAVVDANAIISGLRLQGFADKYYTIAEVLNEIRDKQARAFLSTLPYGIEVREPSEESVKAGE